ISGTGTIVVNGTITVTMSAPNTTTNVLFISTATDPGPNKVVVSLGGNSTVYGYFYAPNGSLSLAGGTSVFGGLSALNVAMSGQPFITVPDDGRATPPSPLSASGAPGWEE